MRRKMFLLFSLAALVAVTAIKAQVSKAAICDGIPAQIRGSSAVLSGQDDPWSILSKADHPFIEMADKSEMRFVGFGDSGDKAQFVKEFVTKFNASDALQKEFADFLDAGNVEVLSLAGSGGEGQLGCCTFPGPILIFYRLKDGLLDPVGSAVVEKDRGTLQSVRAIPSR